MSNDGALIPLACIQDSILQLRGVQVILDRNLAELYGGENRALKQAVKRNPDRFPSDFMFELNKAEVEFLVSQSVIPSKRELGGAAPYAFTEQGVAMLSSVLRSHQAVQVNIEIMRAFVNLRALSADHKALARRLNKLEQKYDKQFAVVFDAIRAMMNPPQGKKQPIGFVHDEGKDDAE